MADQKVIVEEVIELADGTRGVGNSEEVSIAEAAQRVRVGGWKVQGLPIGKLPEVGKAAAEVAGHERD